MHTPDALLSPAAERREGDPFAAAVGSPAGGPNAGAGGGLGAIREGATASFPGSPRPVSTADPAKTSSPLWRLPLFLMLQYFASTFPPRPRDSCPPVSFRMQPQLITKTLAVYDRCSASTTVSPAVVDFALIALLTLLSALSLSATNGMLFMSFLNTDYEDGGLGLNPAHFSGLVAIMCLCQLFYQFYAFPRLGPPGGPLTHVAMVSQAHDLRAKRRADHCDLLCRLSSDSARLCSSPPT